MDKDLNDLQMRLYDEAYAEYERLREFFDEKLERGDPCKPQPYIELKELCDACIAKWSLFTDFTSVRQRAESQMSKTVEK